MKTHTWFVSALLASSVSLSAYAQQVRPSSLSLDQSGDEEFVELPVFGVSSERVDGYRAVDSAAVRLRKELIDTPTTINVITSEFMNDIGAATVTDGMLYVSGVSASPRTGLAGLRDDVVIRGFTAYDRSIDGWNGVGSFQASIDPALIERVEVLKGPNAFLAPSGSPGGGYNLITKSPLFEQFNELSVELADEYFGNRVVFDSTGKIPGTENFAYRVIATHRDAESYVGGRIINKTFSPMLTWRISPTTQLKLKVNMINWRQTGIQASDPFQYKIRDDVAHGRTVSLADMEKRTDDRSRTPDWMIKDGKPRRINLDFTTKLGEILNLHVAALYEFRAHNEMIRGGLELKPDGPGSSQRLNPETGEWTGGVWALQDPSKLYDRVTNPYIESPYAPNYTTATLWEDAYRNFAEDIHYQMDLYGSYELGRVRGEPLAVLHAALGVTYSSSHWRNWGTERTTEDVTAGFDFSKPYGFSPPRPMRQTAPKTNPGYDGSPKSGRKTQSYINTQADFFRSRLQLNGSLANREERSAGWYSGGVPAGQGVSKKTMPSFGVLYKVTSRASIYAAHAENSDPSSYWNGVADQSIWSDGKVDEFGGKIEFFNRRLFITGSYFEIEKTNIVMNHPDAWREPERSPNYPQYLSDESNKGFEIDVTGKLAPGLTGVLSYTKMKVRDQFGRPRSDSADLMYNAMLKYSFENGTLNGLSINFGFIHTGRTAGGNFGTTDIGVVTPPSFFLPSRTLFNAGASYAYKSLRFQLNVDNVFDKEALVTGANRELIGVAPPRNVRLTTTYSF